MSNDKDSGDTAPNMEVREALFVRSAAFPCHEGRTASKGRSAARRSRNQNRLVGAPLVGALVMGTHEGCPYETYTVLQCRPPVLRSAVLTEAGEFQRAVKRRVWRLVVMVKQEPRTPKTGVRATSVIHDSIFERLCGVVVGVRLAVPSSFLSRGRATRIRQACSYHQAVTCDEAIAGDQACV